MPSPFPNLPADQRGTLHRHSFDGAALRSNPWGDPSVRDVFVYTPAGSPGPLPCVLVLAPFSGTGESLLGRSLTDISIATRFDRLIADGCPPFIGVLPDCMTRLGGSQYVDSPGLGDYASYVLDDVRAEVSGRFDTTGRWATVGRSSGGFGGLHLAMRYPGSLNAVGSSAGDMGFDLAYLGDLPGAVAGVQKAGGVAGFVDHFWAQNRPSGSTFAALNVLAMSCAYSPDPSASPIPARFPVDFETGAVDFDVFRSWLDFDPVVEVDRPERRAGLEALDGLFLDAGQWDEYHLQLGLRRFVAKLERHGVAHEHEEFPGGHRGTNYRLDWLIRKVVGVL